MDVLVERVVERHKLWRITDRPRPLPLAEGIIQAILRLNPTVINALLLTGDQRFLHPRNRFVTGELRESLWTSWRTKDAKN